jgi:predicted nucleotidyltransferase
VTLVESQLAALREIERLWPEANAVVIGATALGFYFDMSWRRTADVDFVVALTVDALPALASRPGWSRHPRREYEFNAPGGAKVDLIPASPQVVRAGRLEWRNRDVMSLVGMDLAFKYAARHAGGVLVAPASVVALLKMVAFADRPTERERDLVDIAHLLDAYVDEEDERRWDETPDGTEFDLAPAYLFGVDLAARAVARRSPACRQPLSRSDRSDGLPGASLDAQQWAHPLANRTERAGPEAAAVQGGLAARGGNLSRPREGGAPSAARSSRPTMTRARRESPREHRGPIAR